MKIEHKEIKDGIVQVTTSDERWYWIPELDKYLPSLTWILSHYPKGKQFNQWLKSNGENSDEIRDEAAVRGSKIHQALEKLKEGIKVEHDDIFLNTKNNKEEELTAEEYEAVINWVNWVKENNVKFLENEQNIYSKEYGFAMTLDDVFRIGDEVYINDIKTSKSIQDTHIMQVSAIRKALNEMGKYKDSKLSILQVGYTKNKKGIKFNVEGDQFEDDFTGFLISKKIWEREVKKKNPPQKDLPLSISL